MRVRRGHRGVLFCLVDHDEIAAATRRGGRSGALPSTVEVADVDVGGCVIRHKSARNRIMRPKSHWNKWPCSKNIYMYKPCRVREGGAGALYMRHTARDRIAYSCVHLCS